MKINIKPLSVNEAWKGQRYKTEKYRKYQSDVLFMLPNIKVSGNALKIDLIYGFSNKGADIDNPTKMILDILQKKYNFNDNQIVQLVLTKKIVKKGQEYFDIYITELS